MGLRLRVFWSAGSSVHGDDDEHVLRFLWMALDLSSIYLLGCDFCTLCLRSYAPCHLTMSYFRLCSPFAHHPSCTSTHRIGFRSVSNIYLILLSQSLVLASS
jgi:hypothetical protein